MNYIVRSVKKKDFKDLYNLSKGSHLFNFPHNKDKIQKKIEISLKSFLGSLRKDKSEYFFVVENLSSKKIVGCSQVLAQHGTKRVPFYSLKISTEKKWNSFLKRHLSLKTLELTKDSNGPTEVGGLMVHPDFRKKEERIGELISHSRFLYIALKRNRFKKDIYAFMEPVLMEGGISPFWEAFGARLTECSYDKAVEVSHKGQKEDFLSLFPKEGTKFYLCLMDARIELVMSRVNDKAYPAFKLLKKMGFHKTDHIDPFDGGPYVAAKVHELEVIKKGRSFLYKSRLKNKKVESDEKALVGFIREGEYKGGRTFYFRNGREISFPENVKKIFKLSDGEKVFLF